MMDGMTKEQRKAVLKTMTQYLQGLRRDTDANRSDYEAGKKNMLDGIIWDMECLLRSDYGRMGDGACVTICEALRLS